MSIEIFSLIYHLFYFKLGIASIVMPFTVEIPSVNINNNEFSSLFSELHASIWTKYVPWI